MDLSIPDGWFTTLWRRFIEHWNGSARTTKLWIWRIDSMIRGHTPTICTRYSCTSADKSRFSRSRSTITCQKTYIPESSDSTEMWNYYRVFLITFRYCLSDIGIHSWNVWYCEYGLEKLAHRVSFANYSCILQRFDIRMRVLPSVWLVHFVSSSRGVWSLCVLTISKKEEYHQYYDILRKFDCYCNECK